MNKWSRLKKITRGNKAKQDDSSSISPERWVAQEMIRFQLEMIENSARMMKRVTEEPYQHPGDQHTSNNKHSLKRTRMSSVASPR